MSSIKIAPKVAHLVDEASYEEDEDEEEGEEIPVIIEGVTKVAEQLVEGPDTEPQEEMEPEAPEEPKEKTPPPPPKPKAKPKPEPKKAPVVEERPVLQTANWLSAQLHDDSNGLGIKILERAEEISGVKREYIVFTICSLFCVYLIAGWYAELICNLTGFLYPAYVSVKAIESPSKRDDTQWLTYWCIIGFLSLTDFTNEFVIGIPAYWVFKFAFIVWLILPSTKGASKVYHNALRPLMKSYNGYVTSLKNRIK